MSSKCCFLFSDLYNHLESISKTTNFTYARIDLRRLLLIANESKSLKTMKQVEFGVPTICDSEMCANGVASVDLRGTHFQLKVCTLMILLLLHFIFTSVSLSLYLQRRDISLLICRPVDESSPVKVWIVS